MKKFFAQLFLFFSVIAAGIVATPLRAIEAWVASVGPIITTYEAYIPYLKGGLGALMILGSLIFLFVSFYEVRNYGGSTRSTSMAAFAPLVLFGFAGLLYAFPMAFQLTYEAGFNLFRRLPIVAIPLALLNIIIFSHNFAGQFRKGKCKTKLLFYIFALELALIGGFVGYLFHYYRGVSVVLTISLRYYALLTPIFLVLYLIHLIVVGIQAKKNPEQAVLEEEVKEIKQQAKELQVQKENKPVAEKKLSKAEQKALAKQPQVSKRDEKKTLIVSKSQTIISSEHDVDPTNLLYEDVNVDPEFNKTANLDKQISTIDYYIEKPKLTKPLDPQFDELVQYLRDMSNVVTKLADERITFYVDRKPFMVLMNFGNYYRMVFRADLEKGIRLIIKYPTISKNKAAKDDLWFKANNYGDLPREIVFDIAKSAYDNVNL